MNLLNVFFFAEPSFIDTTNITLSPGGIEVDCSVYDPCLQAVIELKCQDSSGIIVYDVIQPSSIDWSHTIPKILLTECETYTVIIIVSYPGIDNVTSHQSEISYQTNGECCVYRVCFKIYDYAYYIDKYN